MTSPLTPGVLQRHYWKDHLVRSGELFKMTKNDRSAVADLWSHQLGCVGSLMVSA